MGIPFWSIAAGSVALVWIYTHKSGIKTIVWTDTLQTFCLIAALISILVFVTAKLNLDFSGVIQTISSNEHSRIFVFDDWMSRQNFFKQFLSGIFIVIVMTGLDQDMMQKNLSCRSLRDAQKNMYCYGFAFAPLNLLFLGLGILLLVLAQEMQLELPAAGDDILPLFATQGYLGEGVLYPIYNRYHCRRFQQFGFSLNRHDNELLHRLARHRQKTQRKKPVEKRNRVHIGLSVLLIFFICLVDALNNQSVIDAIYIIASYTYGPLLGMFAFGLFTQRKQTTDGCRLLR